MSIRDQIIETADRLFYEQGYAPTSFSHIADAVGISRGNFYYHFKTKDDILDAVIDLRLARTRQMLDEWAATVDDPAERILLFVEILLRNQDKIMRHGCPVGSLCQELTKLDHAAQGRASGVMALFAEWLREQFERMGCGGDSAGFALHLLGRTQGVAALANAFGDPAYIRQEVHLMGDWVRARRPPVSTPARAARA
ncbi:MAG: TetR family transcriptional regulator [Hydrogenophaga sp.]|uniref:TetR/AcrR family transcriptional regulator n=1 Tax=Hydrogenophaga sp. TaxID=1904254 RepID=UPI00169B3683|nr:TetR/AcrR family transcriptional regulator [Hydrogenophaga sp.]NIM40280.1 TetR family transcriptional regulator [Hydrogenophaga sp.]NIN25511.1 TetR family transcriptional regulator [Hydrogenophaga sp.]NIN30163.1 TetR family transcriptional regulator [Hydrogenophaga sp.]NIN54464.1 TetR family transcriptional regulator [Hydrogenophaga sp.]NIO50337.1 TetR family transcriptional regulator [Hydrogenophaga sp.]